jgi:predicted MFS family arabinose efflux permease
MPETESQSDDVSELRTGWRQRLLFAALLGTGVGLPTMPFYTVGIYAPIWAKEFGWSFASIFGGLVITTTVLLFGGPFVGLLIDRYGARTVAAISLAGLAAGYMTLAFLGGSIAQYYVSWTLLSVAGIGATSISFTRAVNGAFVRRRGLALGIALSGIGLFALTVKPLAGWLIETVGWRMTVVAVGALPLLVGVTAILWGFPAGRGGAVSGASAAAQPSLPGLTLREAVRTRAFKIMVCAFIAISFANGAPIPHLENILRSVSIDTQRILTLTSFIGVAMVAGRLLGGWLLDKIWAPLVGVIVLCAAAVGCWMLSQPPVSEFEAMAAILLLGFAGGVEVDLLSYLTARYMGVRSYGAVYGTLFGLFAIGAGAGPSLIGLAFDRLGSYSQILMGCVVLLLLAAGLLLSMGRYPQQVEP